MTKFNEKALQQIIEASNYLRDYIDTPYITTSESFESEEELFEYLQERITEAEIIYYSNAIEFLSEEDSSLTESLSIAQEYGYTLNKINSELLATLLLQQKLSEELSSLDLSECFIEEEEDNV
jgi:sulfatase maturation enzyme AslB (radical SAM superfamily)